jgi:hypothetical protein
MNQAIRNELGKVHEIQLRIRYLMKDLEASLELITRLEAAAIKQREEKK